MSRWLIDVVPVGHQDERRTILDVISRGVLGESFTHLSVFDKLNAKNYVGRHYHKKMSEVYFIFSGEGVMRLRDVKTDERQELTIGPHSRVIIPFEVVHELVAATDMVLMIAATSEKGNEEDTFPG